jgi:hypothetical protein
MPGPYLAKPTFPSWQPARAPAGCRLYLPMTEGTGRNVRDVSGRSKDGAFAGTLAWQSGYYGPQIGGFSATSFLTLDPPQQILHNGVFPWWAEIMVINSTVTAGTVFSQGSSATNTPQIAVTYNSGAVAGRLQVFVLDDAGVGPNVAANGLPLNDGLPHVVRLSMLASNAFRLYFDGVQVGSSVTNVGTMTHNRLTIGANRRVSVSAPFTGSAITIAAGNSAMPDPQDLATDWLSGRFPAVRPPRRIWFLGVTTLPPPPFLAAWARGSNQLIGGGY